MKDKNLIYCKGCRYFNRIGFEFDADAEEVNRCTCPEFSKELPTPVQMYRPPVDCLKKNKNNDCKQYRKRI